MEFGYLNSIRKSTIIIFVEFHTLVWSCVANSVTDVSVVSGCFRAARRLHISHVTLNVAKKFVRISCIKKLQ